MFNIYHNYINKYFVKIFRGPTLVKKQVSVCHFKEFWYFFCQPKSE